MRLLLVEDEDALRESLAITLREAGYAVDTAANGTDGQFCGDEYPLDVAIIDIGLPDFSGIELIQRLRANQHRYPILVLTARGRWQDKVEGLEAGADDYLTKPFHNEELLARLNALLRRSAGAASPVLSAGPIALDTSRQEVRLHEKPVELTAYEYKVLHYLIANREAVVSKTELSQHVYDEDSDRDSNVIEVFIRRLRQKLDPDSSLQPIETLRGRGYRLSAQLESRK